MVTLNKNNKLVISKTMTRILVSYLIVILISISLISLIMYNKFSKATIEDIQGNIQLNLVQNMNQFEIIRNQVYALGMQLISDSDIVYAIYHDEAEEITKYKAINKLKQIRDINPMIHSIYVYNSKGKYYLSSFGTSVEEAFIMEMEQLTKRYKDSIKFNFVPLVYSFKDRNGYERNENIVTSIFSDSSEIDFGKSEGGVTFQDSVVIINLKAEYLQKSFTVLDSSSNIFLLNRNGVVICDSNFENYGRNMANTDFIKDILKSGKLTGYFTTKDTNNRIMYTYSTSRTVPFLFVNKSNYSALLTEIHNLRLSILIVFVLIFLISSVISILAAYNVYLPFDKLVKDVKLQLPSEGDNRTEERTTNELEYLSITFTNIIQKSNELESSIQENIPMVRKMFLKSLLEGDTASLNDISKKLKEMKIRISEGKICVLLLSIDRYSKIINISSIAQQHMKTKIESIINEELLGDYSHEIIDLEGDLTAVIISSCNENIFSGVLMGKVSSMQKIIAANSSFTVSAAIGLTVDKAEDIHLYYGNCLELIKYRFVYGYNALLDNSLILSSVDKSYPSIEKNSKKIVRAIKSCDIEQMEMEIDEVIQLITDRQYDYIRLTINQLVLDIMKAIEPLVNTDDYTMDFNNIFSNINNIDVLEDVREWFILFCKGIIQKLEGKKDNKKKDMVDSTLIYIEENYNNPELNAEMLSELVNITAGYFGRLFNEYTGKSFNEYIIELRMKKAKELLAETTASASDIAARVGFSSQSYFTATFRKLYGITPNQYRIDSRKKGI